MTNITDIYGVCNPSPEPGYQFKMENYRPFQSGGVAFRPPLRGEKYLGRMGGDGVKTALNDFAFDDPRLIVEPIPAPPAITVKDVYRTDRVSAPPSHRFKINFETTVAEFLVPKEGDLYLCNCPSRCVVSGNNTFNGNYPRLILELAVDPNAFEIEKRYGKKYKVPHGYYLLRDGSGFPIFRSPSLAEFYLDFNGQVGVAKSGSCYMRFLILGKVPAQPSADPLGEMSVCAMQEKAAADKPRKRIILEETGETRVPKIGEWVMTGNCNDMSLSKCVYESQFRCEYKIHREVPQ